MSDSSTTHVRLPITSTVLRVPCSISVWLRGSNNQLARVSHVGIPHLRATQSVCLKKFVSAAAAQSKICDRYACFVDFTKGRRASVGGNLKYYFSFALSEKGVESLGSGVRWLGGP